MTSGVASRIQKTGAPISRSRIVPPPIAATVAKKQAAMMSSRWRAAVSAPDTAKTDSPAMLR